MRDDDYSVLHPCARDTRYGADGGYRIHQVIFVTNVQHVIRPEKFGNRVFVIVFFLGNFFVSAIGILLFHSKQVQGSEQSVRVHAVSLSFTVEYSCTCTTNCYKIFVISLLPKEAPVHVFNLRNCNKLTTITLRSRHLRNYSRISQHFV
jgi:hypothetical protein